MNPTDSVNLIYDSINNNKDVMYLNMFDNHLSYITDLKKFIKKYECEKCNLPEIFRYIQFFSTWMFLQSILKNLWI